MIMPGSGKKIAIASGKGGTGKTTVAVNLAYVLDLHGIDVRYLDCDVEEPNAHIFLKPQIDDQITVTVPVPEVDSARCTGCGRCSQVCQFGAIINLKKNVMVFEELCHSCRGCILFCPENAITEKPCKIGTVRTGAAGRIKFYDGFLSLGKVRTPELIARVKKASAGDGIAIIDSPPGASCPAVAAMEGSDFVVLVAEPTPFGLNDLKIAVATVVRLGIDFGVFINRHGMGNDEVISYCMDEDIDILGRAPDLRRAGLVYSKGQILSKEIDSFKAVFDTLAERLGLLNA